jgi:NRPS condensation-like uncharacterized protein
VRLRDDVRLDALERALWQVIDRHTVLKTRYCIDDNGENYQCVIDTAVTLHAHTVRSDKSLLLDVKKQISLPFDLGAEPPIRIHRYKKKDSQYLLILCHHIVSDGWSTDIFLNELAEAYQALCAGTGANLPALDIDYADYAVWQRSRLQGERLGRLLEYWRQTLSGHETLNLYTDRPRPNHIDYQGRDLNFELDDALSAKLRELAQESETTLYTVLLSGFYVALSKLSGQSDIVIGTPSDNRQHAQTQPLIGLFANSLALRATVEPGETIAQLIKRVHGIVASAKTHQELPFEKLVDALDVERDPSRHPVFQIMFGLGYASTGT